MCCLFTHTAFCSVRSTPCTASLRNSTVCIKNTTHHCRIGLFVHTAFISEDIEMKRNFVQIIKMPDANSRMPESFTSGEKLNICEASGNWELASDISIIASQTRNYSIVTINYELSESNLPLAICNLFNGYVLFSFSKRKITVNMNKKIRKSCAKCQSLTKRRKSVYKNYLMCYYVDVTKVRNIPARVFGCLRYIVNVLR